MGLYAEGDHEAKEDPRGNTGASVQLRGIYDALHVSFCYFTCVIQILLSCMCVFLLLFAPLLLCAIRRPFLN